MGVMLISKGFSPETVFGKEYLWQGEMPQNLKLAALICLKKFEGFGFNYKTMEFYPLNEKL
jgi:hypothetical protein